MINATEWKKLRRKIKEQGFRIEESRHIKIFDGDQLISVMPSSPGRGRALRNQIAQLRRVGIKV